MEVKEAGKVKTTKMTDEVFKAYAMVANDIKQQLRAMDVQSNPNYPYMNATYVDICRMYGIEAMERNALNLNTKQ
jgi:hypothetical protein